MPERLKAPDRSAELIARAQVLDGRRLEMLHHPYCLPAEGNGAARHRLLDHRKCAGLRADQCTRGPFQLELSSSPSINQRVVSFGESLRIRCNQEERHTPR